ncbi:MULTISPECIES: major capsid protein [unclassified Saccharibacter]|uniref:major capsid protein n=1 Tax=unclassified Saccharibacter TaxID=2648722 RepID=UPI00132332BA|nr:MULTISPECIES: hypothetical protein [unclassified Saccharibacter]MXV35863.1 hypothetical protein [Saccharibacter sp. EH611]MXV57983.1 hypothetical protein [Saccharibacter sp. EH70]MXV66378.1 hypothetical protein [Saccharibacter sp. EH60]
MALNNSTFLTLTDWATRRDPNGGIADTVNLLSQTNEILNDLIFKEGNLPTGNKTTVRTGLPAATWRLLNYGVPRGKSTTAQVTDTCGMLETYSLVDKDLANLEGDVGAFRLSEDMAFLEGMNQQMARTLIYGNEQSDVGAFTGLSPRYNTLDTNKAASAANVMDGKGRGSTNTSIWLCCWGPTAGFGIFPKGSVAGLQQKDVTTDAPVMDDQGNPFQAYQMHYKWDCGLTIRDWRYFVRIANIDVNALTGEGAANLIALMAAACFKPPTMPSTASNVQSATRATGGTPLSFGRPVFYVNRTIASALSIQAMNKTNVLLTQDEFDGKPVLRFRGIPIRVVDAIMNTEDTVQ